MARRHLMLAVFFAVTGALSLALFVLAYPQRALVVSNQGAMNYDQPEIQKFAAYNGKFSSADVVETPSDATTTILFVGDMMFDRTVATRSKSGGGSDYPFRRVGNLKHGDFGDYDLVVGNLEGPVNAQKHSSTKSIVFSFDPSVLPVLKQEGFDAVSQANNHSLDQGRDGAEESLRRLAMAGIASFGDQARQVATSSMAILESHGSKIALLGFNTTDVRLDKPLVQSVVDRAMREADYVVVFMHWGNEYKEKPNADQVALAHWFIELGAAGVIGGHPHWMESVEVYRGRPIVYSLGNFIFDQDWSKETNYGLAVGLGLCEQGSELKLYPIKIEKSQPYLLTGEERQARLDRLAAISDVSLADEIKTGIIFSP